MRKQDLLWNFRICKL